MFQETSSPYPPLGAQCAAAPPLKKLALFTVGEIFGGVERHVLALLKGLRAADVDASLLLFHDAELARQARSAGFPVDVLPGCNYALFSTARKVASILSARAAQLVHVHGYKATVVSALAQLWSSIPIVKTEHGLPELVDAPVVQRLKTRIYYQAERVATRRASSAVCFVTEELKAHSGRFCPRTPSLVVPNAIERLHRGDFTRPVELFRETFNLVLIGRLESVKGHRVAIEALASKRVPANVHVFFIGTGPLDGELRELTRANAVDHRIHFLGFRRDVYNFLAHCEALLMPSLHEGLPYTMLEAMALGCPIIASNVGGLAEVLRHEHTAILVPAGDVSALADAIAGAVSGPDLLVKVANDALALQRSTYSLDAMTDRYLAVYRDALRKDL